MSFVFEMPEVGEGVVEAEVVEWFVAVGDRVAADQPLCEITTDKAQLEIPCPRSGVVLKLHAEPGDIIRVHTPLVELDESGTAVIPKPESAGSAAPPVTAKTEAPEPKATAPVAVTPAPANGAGVALSDPATRGDTKATPAVRRAAREDGIDLQHVPGSGPGGRVTHADLSAFQAPQAATVAQIPAALDPVIPIAPVALPQVTASGTEERVKIIGIRRKIAEAMVRSKHAAPHFTYVEEIDCLELVRLRQGLKVTAATMGVKLTYMAIIAKACSVAFRQFPNVNAVMDEEKFELVVKGDHHIGFACDTPNGLMVPVVKNVEQKSILRVAAELADVTARTRVGQAKRDELMGSTFTITSVGNLGGVLATPILNSPEVGILGVNQIRDRAVVVDGEIVIRPMMYLSPSFDHRIIDGMVGARFIARLKALLEAPEQLLLELS